MNALPPKNFVAEPFQYHEELELTIHTLTNEGRGIGRINNWAIMVPFVIPGEKVRVRIFRNHKNYSEADLVEILEPSPERIQPYCPLFGKCGGCQYQHISYENQLKWKRQQVVDCLERIGKIKADVQPLIPSEKIFGYRTKLTPHFEKHGEHCPIGFLMEGSKRTIVDVPQCPIASENINQLLPKVREEVKHSNSRHGTLLLREDDQGVSTDFNANCVSTVHDFTFNFPAGSFFQNNPYILKAIFNFLEDFIQQKTDIRYLVDTYCGVGVFGIALSKFVEQFIGIEIDEKSIDLANKNMDLNHINNGKFVAGDAQTIFKNVPFDPNKTLVIMDPPRKGTDDVFLQQLVSFDPTYIAYISCAPDTQARDLNRLQALAPQYNLTMVQPFDMFPQTKHMECVALLEQQL